MKVNIRTVRLLIFPVVTGLMGSTGLAADEESPIDKEELRHVVIEAREVAKEWADKIRSWKDGEEKPTTYMGIVIESVPDVLRDYVDLPKGVGLLLPKIAKDGPAEKAGLMDNDIILKFDGQWVINYNQLSTLIEMKGAGATVPVTVMRKGEELTFEVTLEERMRKKMQFMVPEAPEIPDIPDIPDMEELGSFMEQIDEWIPGSVRVFIDENEQVHVDLDDLKNDLGELKSRMKTIHILHGDPEDIVHEHGDLGARTTRVRIADKDINFKSAEGRVVLNSSGASQHVMVWDNDENLLYEGPLPDDYQDELPAEAVKLIQSLEELKLDLDQEDIEVELNLESATPITLLIERT